MDPMWENQQSAGWSKGNPLFKEAFTVFISSWTTVDVLKIIFKLKMNNRFSIYGFIYKLPYLIQRQMQNYLRSSNELEIAVAST